jgi:hypothetical protein
VNRAEIARAVVACEVMAKQLRSALADDAEAEFREQGTVPTWRLPGITVSGSATHPSVSVVNEAAFLAWVRDRYPTEVEQMTVTRVRPVWQQMFLRGVAGRGDPPCDEQGEHVPGLEWRPGGGFGGVVLKADPLTKDMVRTFAREIVAGVRPLSLPAEVRL